MLLKNHTNIPDEKIREIIRFVTPNRVTGFDVRIGNSKNEIFRGRAYPQGSPYHNTANPFIVVKLTKDETVFPYFVRYKSHTRTRVKLNPQSGKFEVVSYNTGTGGYIDHLLLSREEVIVHVIAHELRHLWHAKVKKGYRVWGARGQFSDKDADAYAIRKTREWRLKKRTEGTIADLPYEHAKCLFSLSTKDTSSVGSSNN
jgi:hypothetical protein